MAIRLRLRFRVPQLALLLKAALFGGFLTLAKMGGLGIFPTILFVACASFLYASPLFRTTQFVSSFIVLITTSLWALSFFRSFVPIAGVILVYTVLFWALLGVKNLHFVERRRWHYLLHIALLYILYGIFFLGERSFWFTLELLIVFCASLFLWKEFIAANGGGYVKNYAERRGAAALIAFVTIEFLWAVNLLPLGFISAANIALLFTFVTTNMYMQNTERTLTRQKLLSNVLLFIACTILIFATSQWTI